MELVEEEDAQLFRQHGWVLHELINKSKYKAIVENFSMTKEEKKSIESRYMKHLDVGTKTGLIFPKFTFMEFMKSSDTFIGAMPLALRFFRTKEVL